MLQRRVLIKLDYQPKLSQESENDKLDGEKLTSC